MQIQAVTILFGAVLAIAAPANNPISRTSLTKLDFEDATSDPAASISKVDTDGHYKGYNFKGFSISDVGKLPTDGKVPINRPGVPPHSGNKYIVYGTTDVQTLATGLPAIIAPDDITKTVTMTSFWYGCTPATKTSLAAVPAACDVIVSCLNKDKSTKLGPLKFNFPVSEIPPPLSKDQLEADLSDANFSGCASIAFNVEGGSLSVAVDAEIDDITIGIDS